jgi:putative molybdopterin biosynthesis protein
VIGSLGKILVHGVAVRPGHPVILGMLNTPRIIPIIGVPGYPVSAALTMEIFVESLIACWLGRTPYKPMTISAKMTRKITSPAGDDDYVRVVVGKVGEQTLAAPLSRGSGVITSLVRADGIAVIPRGVQGYQAGEDIQVNLYRQPNEFENTILAIGSHDIILDLLAQSLAMNGRRLISSNVGSLGGLMALRRNEAHFAGSHLLDPQTGEYNLSYIKEYLPDIPVRIITLVGRQQGLLIRKNNPKNIMGLDDLTHRNIRFINRQRGAGTRVLLDYHLKLEKIDPKDIQGYDYEEYTHLAVAVAISSDRADCGLGIAAAARALDLDFIPLFQERYDLIIPVKYAEMDLLKPLLDLLFDKEFRNSVASLPGYDVSIMGNIII